MKIGNFLWGMVIIAIGVILGLNALGIADIDIFFDGWWTLFIIIPSFIGLITEKDKEASFIFLVVGVVLLLACNDLISFEIIGKLALPVILILIGIHIIFKDRTTKEVKAAISKSSTNDGKTFCATFKEDIIKADKEFEPVMLEAIFGSIRYDMSEVVIKKEAVIKVSSIFGTVKVLAPKGVNVKYRSSGLFKDHICKVKNEDAKNTLYIDAYSLFGSVIVYNK